MKFHIPRGTSDVLPGESEFWEYVEKVSKDTFKRYNYKQIITPIFEHTELFQRGVGETTDIVEKEMYTFMDRGDRSLTLRPEGTAAVVRSYVENKLYASPDPTKLYYIGPMFRYERPQAGRTRQFTQVGVEVLGSSDPTVDAEVLALAMRQFEELGLHEKVRLEINSVGCSVCRPTHREKLVTHLHGVKDQLCKDCQSRLERNPMRILDCKNETCREVTKDAPTMDQHLCEDCQTHHDKVKASLDYMEIPFVENPRLVRGLDYYTQTAFEIMAENSGPGGTLCGGGRYNGLVAEIGGDDVPGIGYAFSIERILALRDKELPLEANQGLDVYLVTLGDQAKLASVKILEDLRRNGIKADMDYLGRKMKAQMKAADRTNADYVLIIGDEELEKGIGQLRNMKTGEQEEVSLTEIVSYLKEKVEFGG